MDRTGVELDIAQDTLYEAAKQLFSLDRRIQAVGINSYHGRFGYRAVRNSAAITAQNAADELPPELHGVPVTFVDTPGDIEPLYLTREGSAEDPETPGQIPERLPHRPITCGLQIQNYDHDRRRGIIGSGYVKVGTLGCLIRFSNGRVGILSNNHVIAGENDGEVGDRILQCGCSSEDADVPIATLHDFEPLQSSPKKASLDYHDDLIVWNEIDAGVAILTDGIKFRHGYLSARYAPNPTSKITATPPVGFSETRIGEEVFKVGRTTGITHGIVRSIANFVPAEYDVGRCWFRGSIEIESMNEKIPFSRGGDSGSAIVNMRGEIVGLLYAGNGTQSYACPVVPILKRFDIDLNRDSS